MHRLANDLRRARLRVPGVRPPELESFAERAGRSFLATAENALALARNLAWRGIRTPAGCTRSTRTW